MTGTRIGHYLVVEKLGAGGMGEVWRAVLAVWVVGLALAYWRKPEPEAPAMVKFRFDRLEGITLEAAPTITPMAGASR